MPITVSVGELVTITDRLIDVLRQVKNQLIRHPDPAQDKLVVVLEELSKTFLVLDKVMTDYLSLLFDPTQPLYKEPNRQERQVLIGLEGARTKAEMDAARGHCEKIENIYERYLHKWFADIVSKDKGIEIKKIFHRLVNVDSVMIDSMREIASWLSNEAKETNALVSQGDLDAANARIEQGRKMILPDRQQLSAMVGRIRVLGAEFTRVSGALGS